MEMLGDRDSEEARKIHDPVLERMMEAVHRYEGTARRGARTLRPGRPGLDLRRRLHRGLSGRAR
jgi:hypothetical protein